MPARRTAARRGPARAVRAADAAGATLDDARDLRAKLDASERMRAKMRESLLTLKSAYESASCALKAHVTPKVAMPSECAREIAAAKAEATSERLRRMQAEAALEKATRADAERARELERARDLVVRLGGELEASTRRGSGGRGSDAQVKALERENAALKAEIEKLKAEAWIRAEETRSATDAARRAAGQTFVAALPGVVRERLVDDDRGNDADVLPSTSAPILKKRKSSAANGEDGSPVALPTSSSSKAKASGAGAGAPQVPIEPSLPGEGETWTARPPPPLPPLASLRRPAAKSPARPLAAPARAAPAGITRARPRTTKGKSKSTALNALKAQAEKTKRAFSAPK